jgi:predicted small metal-binding protein
VKKNMTYTLACKDVGADCPYVARGETKEDMMDDAVKHVKEVHGYTDEQINSPKMQEQVNRAIKEE